ncbi:MAG: type II secretion system GspH family protein [Clostridiales bacterium]|jgi:prepilin-type N-terminal cleavage/methylation domain-containing protein|nr:type II secretion system GspH family protein [Clostridiales bacterium]
MLNYLSKKIRNTRGFSLLELIVVILIMGVLAAIIVPNVTAMVDKSRVAADDQTAAVVGKAAMLVVAEDSTVLPSSGDYFYTISDEGAGRLSNGVTSDKIADLCQNKSQLIARAAANTGKYFVVKVNASGAVTVGLTTTTSAQDKTTKDDGFVQVWPKL